MKKIIITDSSLRDGNHSVSHSIELSSIKKYCQAADNANIPIVEVGHGNGLGASSLLIGKASFSDHDMLKTARENLSNSKLGVHVIPGIATIEKDIKPAIDSGVDVFRIASHCTEASVTKSHIEFLSKKNIEVFGVLMMTALASPEELVQNALEMQDYGALSIIIMDSTGTYLPLDVEKRIKLLVDKLNIPVGFHAHNNLNYAVHNSVIAVQNGATYIDACIRGFGAGAGNAPIEILIPVLDKFGYTLDINFQKIIMEADNVLNYLVPKVPVSAPVNILTGLNKLFSGFEKPIINASKINKLEYSSLIFELGNRKLVAGQEDLILEIATNLKNNNE
ncbi:MAG: 4-hydroxy-2-oxovalerate aldolase [Flavobacteriaceae bacterium]|nr:4-hydroxy-2-oxovalerate aldolase [Flavobacteriaceae bacterium]MBT6169949.1 4-hydroxy-2-oxovalerate aldolase [Flavobacteriaceae bacterium]MBT6447312.1 4-hydroxy-2-oxovalerate aldolase [Flavobacteriaceae bacterium]